jgi:hypothetical protein
MCVCSVLNRLVLLFNIYSRTGQYCELHWLIYGARVIVKVGIMGASGMGIGPVKLIMTNLVIGQKVPFLHSYTKMVP